MSDGLYRWWNHNGAVITILAVQAVLIIIWGVKLDSRVDTIETRGSPQIVSILNRMTLFEERQNFVLNTLKLNGHKLDAISEELRKHELDKK